MTPSPSMPDDVLHTLLADDDVAAGRIGSVSVLCVAGILTVGHVDRLVDLLEDHRARWRGRNVHLTLLRARTPLPDEKLRKRIAAVFSSEKASAVSCAVIDSDGFWAAAARGVFASLALVTRNAPHPTRSLDEALRWAQQRLPTGSPDIIHHEAAIAAFRDAHFARRPAGKP
jgi:hypothetical protein